MDVMLALTRSQAILAGGSMVSGWPAGACGWVGQCSGGEGGWGGEAARADHHRSIIKAAVPIRNASDNCIVQQSCVAYGWVGVRVRVRVRGRVGLE